MSTTPSKLKAAIIIISETARRDPSTDKCDPRLRDVFAKSTKADSWELVPTRIVPDDVLQIQRSVVELSGEGGDGDGDAVNLIVTSGGTGFAVKDVTPEAVRPLIHKHAPGLVHAMLASSLAVTPFAAMARPVAGTRNKTLIITLPGSPKGAGENLEAIISLLPHACLQAAGEDSRTAHSGGTKKLEHDAGVSATSSQHQHHHHNHSHGSHAAPKPHTPQSNDPSSGPTRRHRSSPYPMHSVSSALSLIATHTPGPTITTVPLSTSIVGSVLAADVTAPESVPAFRASIVDGYAIMAPSNSEGGETETDAEGNAVTPGNGTSTGTKGVFPVAFSTTAQASSMPPLPRGSIARITTGAPLPDGSNAVVMVEDTQLVSRTADGSEEAEVEILTSSVRAGENVREVGSDVAAGTVVMRAGEGITAIGGELGLLASVGVRSVSVYRAPVVGVLSTGDEIIDAARPGALALGEVRDTNRPTLLTAIRGQGFVAHDLGIAGDKPGALETALRDALRTVDVLITTGGVSMGELDLLKPTLERGMGGRIHFGRVAMKPGKPTTFATVPVRDNGGTEVVKTVFSLPGNPASAVVTFHLFVLPALHKLAGVSPVGLPRVRVVLGEQVRCDGAREEYHRVVVSAGTDGRLWARSTGGQRSSRIGSFKGANALLVLPVREGVVEKGEMGEALLMGRIVSEL